MPFDPELPRAGTKFRSAEIRGNFIALNTRIDTIPAGPQGAPGDKGDKGDKGDVGDPGPAGPPFAQAAVDSVTTLDPGQPATVSVTFDGTTVHFTLAIPRGADGTPGEITAAALAAAIAGTARNPTIAAYTGDFSDPPTQQEMRDYAAYVEALRQSLAR